MSNNKLKKQLFQKISDIQNSLKKWDAILKKTDVEDFETIKPKLINSLKELHSLSLEVEIDVVNLLLKK